MVGLKRNNLSAESLAELKEAHRVLYRSNHNLSTALERLREMMRSDEGRELIAFLQEETDRGILKH
jgi:acyl-[acyl carrier protein]--UDP-N-acetylglucosamine O-acyltransferase